MSFEEFANLAAGIQSIVISLGLLTAGVWALFRFRAFRETEKAKVELDKLRREIVERGVIKISLNPSIVKSDTHKYIKLDMVLENVGNRTEVIDWTNAKIKLARCDWQENGSRQLCDWQDLCCQFSSGLLGNSVIPPNGISGFGYISKSISNGVYYIETVIPGSPQTIAEHDSAIGAHSKTNIVAWSYNTYIEVIDNSQQINPADARTRR